MNTHKNARLTFVRRLEMVLDMTERGLTPCAAAAAQGVSPGSCLKTASSCGVSASSSSRPSRRISDSSECDSCLPAMMAGLAK
ncbi:MAG: hypothetical protein FJY34_02805 [Betaproteobacteria bacterium]|nr:hypothetical protein [Betaproteobacteria bacterium]